MLARGGLGLMHPHGGGMYADYALALDFKNGVYRSGPVLVPAPSTLAGYSYTRAGAKYELDVNGTPIAFAANAPGIAPGIGFWARSSVTNPVLNNTAFSNASWTRRGTIAVTDNNATAPDGTATATLFTGVAGAGAGDIFDAGYAGAGRFPNSTALTPSIFIKRISTVGTLQIQSPIGIANGQWLVNMALLPAGWARITASHPAVTVSNAWVSSATGADGLNIACTSGAPLSFYAWAPQLVAGAIPGPVILTTAAAVTIAADAMSFTGQNIVPPFTTIIEVQPAAGISIAGDLLNFNSLANGGGLYGSAGAPTQYVRESSANTALQSLAVTGAGVRARYVARFAVNDTAISANGQAAVKDASNTPPTLASFGLGTALYGFSGAMPDLPILFAGIIPRALSDAELAAESARYMA